MTYNLSINKKLYTIVIGNITAASNKSNLFKSHIEITFYLHTRSSFVSLLYINSIISFTILIARGFGGVNVEEIQRVYILYLQSNYRI